MYNRSRPQWHTSTLPISSSPFPFHVNSGRIRLRCFVIVRHHILISTDTECNYCPPRLSSLLRTKAPAREREYGWTGVAQRGRSAYISPETICRFRQGPAGLRPPFQAATLEALEPGSLMSITSHFLARSLLHHPTIWICWFVGPKTRPLLTVSPSDTSIASHR